MFFKRRQLPGYEKQVEERIKKDLLQTLRKKGVSISKVSIDMKPDNVNVRVCFNEW